MTAPRRIGLVGYFGAGNTGNEASLRAVLDHLGRAPSADRLVVLCADASVVSAEHGVPADQLWPRVRATRDGGRRPLWRRAWTRLGTIPRVWRLVGRVDALVVPGTGVLESILCTSIWTVPYTLFLVALVARVRGRPFMLLNVGAQEPATLRMRLLCTGIARLATAATARDEESARVIQRLRPRGGVVEHGPDVAFGFRSPAQVSTSVPGRVVVGVMRYSGGFGDRRPDEVLAERYDAAIVQLLARLLDDGRTLRVLVGDLSDLGLAASLVEQARAARPGIDPDRVAVSGARTFEETLREMAEAEVVVASRFHNVIAALKVCRPVLGLGYAPKHLALLQRFGLAEHRQTLDDIDVERALASVRQLTAEGPVWAAHCAGELRAVEAELERSLARVDAIVVGTSALEKPAGRSDGTA